MSLLKRVSTFRCDVPPCAATVEVEHDLSYGDISYAPNEALDRAGWTFRKDYPEVCPQCAVRLDAERLADQRKLEARDKKRRRR